MTNCLENAENTVNVLSVPTNQSQEAGHSNNNNNQQANEEKKMNWCCCCFCWQTWRMRNVCYCRCWREWWNSTKICQMPRRSRRHANTMNLTWSRKKEGIRACCWVFLWLLCLLAAFMSIKNCSWHICRIYTHNQTHLQSHCICEEGMVERSNA